MEAKLTDEEKRANEIWTQLNPNIQNIMAKILEKDGPEVFMIVVSNMAIELMTLAILTVRINKMEDYAKFDFDSLINMLISDIRNRFETAQATFEMHEKLEESGASGLPDELFTCRPLN